MQQTQTYKLNLIETSDTFSPAPLNENMEKVEAGISAEAAARQSGDAALAQRVTMLELHKIAVGTYKGTGSEVTVNLGFAPELLMVQPGINVPTFAIKPGTAHYQLTENGFQTSSAVSNTSTTYTYFAVC